MNRAVIYCRVSSDEQVNNLSLPAQERICRDYCQKNDWDVVVVYVEKGESAKTADRPEFQKMLGFCRQKKNAIDFLVVHSLSRFSRNTEDHVIVAAMLRKLGVKLRSATEPIDDSHIGRFMETVLAGFAELDNRMKAERTVTGLKTAVNIGRWPFLAPLGYLNSTDAAGTPIIIIDLERGPLIRAAFEQFATGLYTQKQVLADIRSRGLRTRKNKTLASQTFESILRNPFYAGWVVVGKWGERKKSNFEPLVDQETFDKVQAILAGRRRTITSFRRNRPDFPLRGFAKCGKCGAPMTAGWSTGRTKRYPYYHCAKHCRGMNVRGEELERQFMAELTKFEMKKELVVLFMKIVGDAWHEKQAHARDLVAAHQRRIASLEERRQRLLDAFIYQQAITQEIYQEQSTKLEAEIAAARIEAATIPSDDVDIAAVLKFAEQMVLNATQFWRESPLDQKQRFQRVLFPAGITVDENGMVGTNVTCPIFNILEAIGTDESKVVHLIVSSWNQLVAWLRQLDDLRQAMNPVSLAA